MASDSHTSRRFLHHGLRAHRVVVLRQIHSAADLISPYQCRVEGLQQVAYRICQNDSVQMNASASERSAPTAQLSGLIERVGTVYGAGFLTASRFKIGIIHSASIALLLQEAFK